MASADKQPKNNGPDGNGRDTAGRFAEGNTLGFQPGESGNPGGRPKGKSLDAELRKALEANDYELFRAFINQGITRAIKGDHKFWNTIAERVYGKVIERLAVAGADELLKVVGDIDVAAVCGRLKPSMPTKDETGDNGEDT